MSKIEVNAIEPQCGTTLTIGASDTSIAGIGTVNWDTTAKTSAFTAVSGRGYFVNTTSGAITVTLPAGSAGSIVSLKDYANTWNTNNVTLTPNGTDKINGVNSNATLDTQDQSVTLIYVDDTKGWRVVQDSTSDVTGAQFVTATGGTITCCGNFKIHTFTGPGTFTVSCAGNARGSNTVDYLVVAGGASGGNAYTNNTGKSGGGGAGGFRESSGTASGSYTTSPLGACVAALPVSVQGYPITVGAGGTAQPPTTQSEGNNGSNSIFSTITSAGGGGGGTSPGNAGQNGGSGGGGSYDTSVSGGTGNTPPVSPAQGTDGGDGRPAAPYSAGGGGGATAAGTDGTDPASGPGGAGATTSISGSPTAYAGGGGGGGRSIPSYPSTKGDGGTGGGGAGGCRTGSATATPGVSGTANTGGGGGAGNPSGAGSVPAGSVAGAGGSGIVIIRYKFQ